MVSTLESRRPRTALPQRDAYIGASAVMLNCMQRELTEVEWRQFEEKVLDDPVERRKWADRVIDSWIKRRSGKSRRRSRASRKA